jgi:hypothetical protein
MRDARRQSEAQCCKPVGSRQSAEPMAALQLWENSGGAEELLRDAMTCVNILKQGKSSYNKGRCPEDHRAVIAGLDPAIPIVCGTAVPR